MLRVVFIDGKTKEFDAVDWNFSDVNSNNVYFKDKEGRVIAHVNWKHVLYCEMVEE